MYSFWIIAKKHTIFRRMYKFQNFTFETSETFEITNVQIFLKELSFTLKWGSSSLFFVIYTLLAVGITFNKYLADWKRLENVIETTKFTIPSSAYKGFKTKLMIKLLSRCCSYSSCYWYCGVVLNGLYSFIKENAIGLIVDNISIIYMRPYKRLIDCY